MKIWSVCLAMACFAITVPRTAQAQVKYRIICPGCTPAVDLQALLPPGQPGQPRRILLESILGGLAPGGAFPTEVRIWDSDPFTGYDTVLEGIEIVGRADPAAQVRVSIALDFGPNNTVLDFDAFASVPSELTSPGLGSLGGLRFVSPTGHLDDVSLRDRSNVAITVLGDITGDIDAGNVWRVASTAAIEGTVLLGGGQIIGNVRTYADGRNADGSLRIGLSSIAFVRADVGISGGIFALVSPAAPPTLTGYSIGRVVAGLGGIKGDIVAGEGMIDSIISMGTIGEVGDLVKIKAGTRVGLIATVKPPDPPAPPVPAQILLPVTLPNNAEVEASVRLDGIASNSIFANISATEAWPSTDTFQHGLDLLVTDGNFFGSIDLINVFNNPGCVSTSQPDTANYPRYSTSANRFGIFVRGLMHAPITVKYNWYGSDIIAGSMLAPIWIGQCLRGSVVATGTTGTDASGQALLCSEPFGRIAALTVGRVPAAEFPLSPNASLVRGIVPARLDLVDGNQLGGITPPFEASSSREWFTRSIPRCRSGARVREVDSVVRAACRIDYLDARRMTNYYTYTEPLEQGLIRPRIEAPLIGTLIIDEMQSGVVWSGTLCPLATGPNDCVNDPSDDYASTQVIDVGCIGPTADLWVQDYSRIHVNQLRAGRDQSFGDVYGEVRSPSLASDQQIVVDGRMAELSFIEDQACACASTPALRDGVSHGTPLVFVGCPTLPGGEPSPRGLSSLEIDPDRSRILLQEDESLHGQIIVDAINDTSSQRPTTHMLGDVLVGKTPDIAPTEYNVVFSASSRRTNNQTAQFLLPLYQALPTTFGTGAVGLVPFAVHVASTQQLNTGANQLVNTRLRSPVTLGCTEQWMTIDFYGPVKLPNPNWCQASQDPPVQITLDGNPANTLGQFFGYRIAGPTGLTDVRKRFLQARPANACFSTGSIPGGEYTITRTGASAALRCDLPTPRSSPVRDPLAASGVVLAVAADCINNNDGCLPDSNCQSFPSIFCDTLDFNQDGDFPTPLDLEDFVRAVEGNCCQTCRCFDLDFNNDGDFPTPLDVEAFISVNGGGDCL